MYKYSYSDNNLKLCECGQCNELIPIKDKWGRSGKYKRGHGSTGKKFTNYPKGEKCHKWKGGRKKRKDGYYAIMKRDHPNCDRHGYVAEHRLVMEKHIGRYLTREEVVHHIDNDPTNNKIENLMLLSNQSEHMILHNNDL